jgi:cellulose synthase (UDP-forming)
MLKGAILLAIAASIYYFSWWGFNERYTSPLLLVILVGMASYVAAQAYCVWYIYLHAESPNSSVPPLTQMPSVDIFLPTFKEPLPLVEKTLRAVLEIRYPHTTFVIDDGRDRELQKLAESLGARYISRETNREYKAGNINNALRCSSGEIVAIFDIDHIPQPDFLDWVVPYFDNPRVGVVQVALDHYNQGESYVATAAARMSDEFFSATMLGMDRCGAAVVFGSNSVFRRSALESLGGYRPGLAEDLNTSLHLHAHGWESVYVPRILAKGLVPSDLNAFYKQQFKWARGVFEVILREAPHLFSRLTARQRICYTTRMTYYLVGLVIGGHIAAGILAPFLAHSARSLGDYLVHAAPLVLTYTTVHVIANRLYTIKPHGEKVDLRGILLVLASWPIYALAFVASLLRLNIAYAPTPKGPQQKHSYRIILPQLFAITLLLTSLGVHALTAPRGINWLFLTFVISLIFTHIALIPASIRGLVRKPLRTDTGSAV